MYKIVVYPAEILRLVAKRVDFADNDLNKMVAGLVEVLQKTSNGAGLAAPQIGISKRFFALKEAKTKRIEVYVNPEITSNFDLEKKFFSFTNNKSGSEEPFLEGCLSIPEVYGQVARWPEIKVRYQTLNGEEKNEIFTDYKAIVFQHELDHLNGVLFVDHVREVVGKLFKDVEGKMVEIENFWD